MAYDETTRKIRENLWLDEFEWNKKPQIVKFLQDILENFDDSKFYTNARADLTLYIQEWSSVILSISGHDFIALWKRLEEAGIVPKNYEGDDVKNLEETFPSMWEVRWVVAKIDKNQSS